MNIYGYFVYNYVCLCICIYIYFYTKNFFPGKPTCNYQRRPHESINDRAKPRIQVT